MYQVFLTHSPERSFRNQFIHRQGIAGYSEDALRNFASSSFNIAYQLSRFENTRGMFERLEAARIQLASRRKEAGYSRSMATENSELQDYIAEMELRLKTIMNPPDVGKTQQILSNVGFIWYLTAPASAITNVLGGMMIGFPTLVGQYVKMYPNLSYTKAAAAAMLQVGKSFGQIMSTGFNVDVEDKRLMYPTMDRNKNLTEAERIAYDRFTADGLIDITATYDQAGLASGPTERYSGAARRGMEILTSLFHNAERFNREIMAMSTFRAALAARQDYKDQNLAIEEAIAEAKDVTHRSMFDYSSQNKPRYFQSPVARVVFQFKQFPQQMTFFLARNMLNMYKGESKEVRREARARFVGTMGMAGIFSGVTGLWGFSTVAYIVNAVVNGMGDEDDEKEPFDFELEFANWAAETFGNNIGTLITRGIGNAAGVDIASRVKLDDMWFRDGRKNQDEAEALQGMLVELLGPTVGLLVNTAEAAKLLNEGHGDRAIEMMLPAFAKQPMVALRYATEGATTLRGDVMKEEFSPFELAMQSIGLRPADLAELQFYNITVKGQEQEILKKRQNLLNLYGLSFMSNDDEAMDVAMEKIDRFNNNYPAARIPMDSLNDSVRERLKKSSQTDHGLYLDKKLRGVLDKYSYAKE
jgi:predicted ester cyclase